MLPAGDPFSRCVALHEESLNYSSFSIFPLFELNLLTRQQCRDADANAIKRFNIPSIVLMENAGRSCVDRLMWHHPQGKLDELAVLILCGPGNNGGDGFVMARHLSNQGVPVKVVLMASAESYSGDALANLNSLARLRFPIVEFDAGWSDSKIDSVFSHVRRRPVNWIVDAMLGTGAKGPPRPPIAKAIKAANRSDVRRLAVDIPSGLDCDTGEVFEPTFRADLTCTFIDRKTGFQTEAAAEVLGVVTVVDIGAPAEIVGTEGR